MDNRITKINLTGFKTFHGPVSMELNPLTVLIGHHGAGKSNFLSFFSMMNHAMLTPGALQPFVAREGGAHNLVYESRHHPSEISVDLKFQTDQGPAFYHARLNATARDTLLFAEEKYVVPPSPSGDEPPNWIGAGSDQTESSVPRETTNTQALNPIRETLANTQVYQLETQGENAPIRERHILTNDQAIMASGGNLAPFLIRLRNQHPWHYDRILQTLRLILPFFEDFEPSKTPDENSRVLLYWKEKGSDRVFSPSQTSDSTLRVMAMVTILMQPQELMPKLMILDEPCLGLHPGTAKLIGGMIESTSSAETQIILATQSQTLMDWFELQDIVVVERAEPTAGPGAGAGATFHRLDPVKLEPWLKDYSISKLWEKNVLNGQHSTCEKCGERPHDQASHSPPNLCRLCMDNYIRENCATPNQDD